MEKILNVKSFIPLIARATNESQIGYILECFEKCYAAEKRQADGSEYVVLHEAVNRAQERLGLEPGPIRVEKLEPVKTADTGSESAPTREYTNVSHLKFVLEPATGYFKPNSTEIVQTKDEAVKEYMIYNLNQLIEEDYSGSPGELLYHHIDDLIDVIDPDNYGENVNV